MMAEKKRYGFKDILISAFWLLTSAGLMVLLVAAVRNKDSQRCVAVDIHIRGVQNNFFIDEKDVLNGLTVLSGSNPIGKICSSFNLRQMEIELKKNIWIAGAQLFFDNNAVLVVDIDEREPVARIFTNTGATYYIDHGLMRLPLSEKFSANLPVFTGFPTDQIILSKADSSLLQDIRNLSLAIQKDSFCNALIDQVDINVERNFEMIPKMGNQIILFGDASNIEEKLAKLVLFYKNILRHSGLSYYSVINLQYKGQVVAKRRGAEDITADSIRTLQIMDLIAQQAATQSADSVRIFTDDNNNNTADSTMVLQSIQRDENDNEPIVDNATPASVPAVVPAKPLVNKPDNKSVQTIITNSRDKPAKPKPRVLMPKNNK